MKLRNKILLPVILVLIAAVSFISLTTYFIARGTVKEMIDLEMDAAINNITAAEKLANEITEIVIKELDSKNIALAKALAEIIRVNPKALETAEMIRLAGLLNVTEVHATDADGVLWWGNIEGFYGFDFKTTDQTLPFMEIIKNPSYTLAQEAQPNSAGIMFSYTGVARTDEPGIIQVGIAAEIIDSLKSELAVNKTIEQTQLGKKGFLIIVEDSVITAHPDFAMIGKDFVPSSVKGAGINRQWIKFDGAEYYAGFYNTGNRTVYSLIPKSEFFTDLNVLGMVCIFVSCAAVLLMGAITFYIAGRISKPLVKSTESLKNITKNIETAVSRINESAATVAESSNDQAASIEQTSAAINETFSMISSNADNTKAAAQLAFEASDIAGSGIVGMREMSKAMEEIRQSSDTVGKIVKTIDDIAFQTNLLAINATVEAARAGGDAGRSFGVVAEEVRSLAQRSASAVTNTTDIIEKNVSYANSGNETSRHVSESFEKITQKINDLNRLISEINTASEEQAGGAGQLTQAINQIEKSTQSNAATSEETAASVAILKELTGELEDIYHGVEIIVYGS